MKIKDCKDHVKKIIVFFQGKSKISTRLLRKSLFFQREIDNFRLQEPEDRFDDIFEKLRPGRSAKNMARKAASAIGVFVFCKTDVFA